MNRDKIPQSDSIQELAQFWDTHDLTDYEDELEEVGETVFEGDTVVKVQLPREKAEAVESIAKSQGIKSSELIRQWVLEYIQKSA